jgi:hypothetical protein
MEKRGCGNVSFKHLLLFFSPPPNKQPLEKQSLIKRIIFIKKKEREREKYVGRHFMQI